MEPLRKRRWCRKRVSGELQGWTLIADVFRRDPPFSCRGEESPYPSIVILIILQGKAGEISQREHFRAIQFASREQGRVRVHQQGACRAQGIQKGAVCMWPVSTDQSAHARSRVHPRGETVRLELEPYWFFAGACRLVCSAATCPGIASKRDFQPHRTRSPELLQWNSRTCGITDEQAAKYRQIAPVLLHVGPLGCL